MSISKSELDEIERRHERVLADGAIPAQLPEDTLCLVSEVRRLSKPQASPEVEALIKQLGEFVPADSVGRQEYAAAISRVRAALTAPSPFDALELWLREDWRRTISWGGASDSGECQIVLQTGRKTYSGVSPTLSEAVAAALGKAGAK